MDSKIPNKTCDQTCYTPQDQSVIGSHGYFWTAIKLVKIFYGIACSYLTQPQQVQILSESFEIIQKPVESDHKPLQFCFEIISAERVKIIKNNTRNLQPWYPSMSLIRIILMNALPTMTNKKLSNHFFSYAVVLNVIHKPMT